MRKWMGGSSKKIIRRRRPKKNIRRTKTPYGPCGRIIMIIE